MNLFPCRRSPLICTAGGLPFRSTCRRPLLIRVCCEQRFTNASRKLAFAMCVGNISPFFSSPLYLQGSSTQQRCFHALSWSYSDTDCTGLPIPPALQSTHPGRNSSAMPWRLLLAREPATLPNTTVRISTSRHTQANTVASGLPFPFSPRPSFTAPHILLNHQGHAAPFKHTNTLTGRIH